MSQQNRYTRRQMFRNSAAILGSVALAGCAPTRRPKGQPLVLSPPRRGVNDIIRIGVAGLRGRGRELIKAFLKNKDIQIVYLVDPDSRLFKERMDLVQECSEGRSKAKCVQDVRHVLDDKNLDAISISTPNHWHALMTIWACQAGKDVYVEKPMSHNVREGRAAVQAARKYKRIVQHGTQNRSLPQLAHVVAVIKSGKLGKLLISRGLCFATHAAGLHTRRSLGFAEPKTPPPGLDFNLWLGPALEQSYHDNLVHYRWNWFWDFGNGDIGNQGAHQADVARWAIAGATLPKSVISLGGRLGYVDQGETASTQIAIYDYGQTQLILEIRGLPSLPYRGQQQGNIFHLEAGTIVNGRFFPKDSDKEAPLPNVEYHLGPGNDHIENFIAAMRSRKVSDLNADVLEGHYSTALCHLGNVSLRIGERVPFKPRTKALEDNEAALDALIRMEEYLESNNLDLSKMEYQLGPKLLVDKKAETIVNDANANKLLTRVYRRPFVVPEKV